jgi:hypothetical protein
VNEVEAMSTPRRLRWTRRGLWEPLTAGLIALGLLMMLQPFSMALFRNSFTVLLTGVLGYTVAGKLPD